MLVCKRLRDGARYLGRSEQEAKSDEEQLSERRTTHGRGLHALVPEAEKNLSLPFPLKPSLS